MSPRPRLLFVSARFLFPVDSGGKIRTTQILRGLKGGAFEIVLASPQPPDAGERFARELGTVCDRFVGWPEPTRGKLFGLTRLRHVLGAVPIPVASDQSASGSAAVARELGRHPDLALFDFPHAAVWAPAHIEAPSVMFTHNVEAEIFERHAQVAGDPLRRALWSSQHRKMQRYERSTLARFDTVIAVSERDARHFAQHYAIGGATTVSVIGTGVDLEFLGHAAPASEPQVVFCGSMDWLANADAMEFFLDQVWPRIAAARPQARMTVVGRSPPPGLVARARQANWTFTGFVDDIRPHIRAAAAYVIPLRVGGGTRLKVFEAMALGCPVVSTTIGVEGLPLEPGKHYLRADEAATMAGAVLGLLDDAGERARLSEAARAYVEANFSFQAIARDFERICLQTLDRAGHAATRPALSPSHLLGAGSNA